MSHPNRLPRVEDTDAYAAVEPPFERYAGDEKVAAALHPSVQSSPELTPVPGWDPAGGRASAAGRLEDPIADAFHLVDCACPDPYAVPGHAEQYAPLAAMTRKTALAEVPPPEPVRYPVETKVIAGARGTAVASTVVVGGQLLLDALNVVPPLLGGRYPWVPPVVLLVGWLLPVVLGTVEAYYAPHSPRTGVTR
jgi:hypothetical protein